jgi:uncharacterized membrane protein (UPF0127 family)
MTIKNLTRKKTLLRSFETAKSPWQKTRGLMFRNSLAGDSGLLMVFGKERRHEIWMLCMRFPIDIVFIDRDKRIVDIKHSVRPMGKNPKTWRIYRPSKPSRYVLEVNSGLAKKTKTKTGDLLDFRIR